jgi:hypothetical protein
MPIVVQILKVEQPDFIGPSGAIIPVHLHIHPIGDQVVELHIINDQE